MALVLAVACATGSRTASPSRTANVITREELDGIVASSAYDAIGRLRPLWLSRLTSQNNRAVPTLVYVDHRPAGGMDALREIPTEQIKMLRYLAPIDARLAYHTQADNGVVEVTLK